MISRPFCVKLVRSDGPPAGRRRPDYGGAMMRNYIGFLKAVEGASGVKAWLVGESARMIEMGIRPKIMTLALDARDLEGVASALGNGKLDLRGPHPVLRGEMMGVPFRAFSLQGDTIEEDLARRDLSIEAFALRSDGGTVDPFGGKLDIRNHTIRLTGDDVELIRTDPLRIVRMLRFAAELEMSIFWKTDTDVRDFLRDGAEAMKAIPAERWGNEILKGMARHPWRFISLCDAYGLLPFFIEELDVLKTVSDGKGRTIFDHVMGTLAVIQSRLDTHKVMQRDSFVLAGLFCHIGDRGTKASREKADRAMAERLARWNIPSDTIAEVSSILDGYASFYRPISEEGFCTAILKHGMEAMDVGLGFAVCIDIAEGTSHDDVLEANRWSLDQVLRRFRSVASQTDGTATRFLTGDEVMRILQMPPGRKVGELLKGLDMAVGTGKVGNRAAAEAWLIRNASA